VSAARLTSPRGAALVALLVAVAPAAARAVSPQAEALFRDGRRLMAEGRIAEACTAFSQSYAADASSGTLLNLAYCHQVQGKVATAWTEYAEAARLARAQGKPNRATAAEQKQAALAPRLARLTLKVAQAVPKLTIATELGTIDEKSWGEALPLDPGDHHLTAQAPGYKPWGADVELKEGDQKSLDVPALESELPPVLVSARPAPPPPVVLLTSAPAPAPRPRRPLDLYLAGAGGLLAIAGTVFYGVAYEKFDTAKSACDQPAGCSAAQRDDLVSGVDLWRDLAIGSWIAGGALAVASGLHHWRYRRPPPVTVAIDPWNDTLSIRARF
jgi:tetratricopeptide (TPR) repeat protein